MRAPAQWKDAAPPQGNRSGPLHIGGAPLHPLAVHLPVALLALVPALDLLRLTDAGGRAAFWADAAWWALAAGLPAAVAAMATGLVDYPGLPQGAGVTRTAVSHMVGMVIAVGLYGLSLLLRSAPLPLEPTARAWLAAAAGTAGLLCLGWGGHHGAQLVYTHGAGRHEH